MKLEINMVPPQMWRENLRRYLSKKEWTDFKKIHIEKFGNKCTICGKEDDLHLHEVWKYDDKHLIQKLEGLILLCHLCHDCIHIGQAENRDTDGTLIKSIKKHFLHINGWNEEIFRQHYRESKGLWRKRINNLYDIDWGKYLLSEDKLFKKDFTMALKEYIKYGVFMQKNLSYFLNSRFIKYQEFIVQKLKQTIIQHENRRRDMARINSKFIEIAFKEVLKEIIFKDNNGLKYDITKYYFEQKGFSKFNRFFHNLIFPSQGKENYFMLLIEKSTVYIINYEFIYYLINTKILIKSLSQIEIVNSIDLLNRHIKYPKFKKRIKNSVLYTTKIQH